MNPVPCFHLGHARQADGRPVTCRQQANIYDQNTEQEGEADEASPQTVDKLGVGCYAQHHFSFKTSFLFIFFKINKNLSVF